MFWKKQKRINELELQLYERDIKIEKGQNKIDDLQFDISELKKKISGERVCDGYCSACKNSYRYEKYPGCEWFGCVLDCKCNDFERKGGYKHEGNA